MKTELFGHQDMALFDKRDGKQTIEKQKKSSTECEGLAFFHLA